MAAVPSIAYLSAGRLFIQRAGQPAREIVSRFAQDVRVRASRVQQRHAWKTAGQGAQFQRGMRGMLWNQELGDAEHELTCIRSIARGRAPGQLIYSLQSGVVSGVFTVNVVDPAPEQTERRLFHTAELSVDDIGGVQGDGYVCCTVSTRRGRHVAVLSDDGSEVTELTEGDSCERAPTWLPGADRQLVFESAGIGTTPNRSFAMGASSLQQLDIPTGAMTTLLSSDAWNFRSPRFGAGGELYCVRNPYRNGSRRPSVLAAVMDLLLFPMRVLFAVLQYLNFFTARYTGKPLTTAGKPRQKGADARQMLVWANLLQARGEADESDADDERGTVPRSVELIMTTPADAAPRVVARGVSCFDLTRDGCVVCSNGRVIHYHDAQGRRHELARAESISAVLVLE